MTMMLKKFPTSALIGGEWVTSGETFPVLDPVTGREIASVPNLSAGHATRAIDAAEAALEPWSRTTAKERAAILKRWFDLSPAQVAVFKTLRKIPLGETRSYEDVARATSLHPRQIGWLVAANHLAILIPCHRVVGKDGSLVGYGGGLAKKRWLLDHELRAAGVVLR